MLENDVLADLKAKRYAGWDADLGRKILAGELSLAQLAEQAISQNLAPEHVSGKQELLENIVNRAIYG